MDKLTKMGARKILADSGWRDHDLLEKVQELLLLLGMDEGLPIVRVDSEGEVGYGPIDDEEVVQCLLELAEMVGVGTQDLSEPADTE